MKHDSTNDGSAARWLSGTKIRTSTKVATFMRDS